MARAMAWLAEHQIAVLAWVYLAFRFSDLTYNGPFIDESFYYTIFGQDLGHVHFLTGSALLWPPVAHLAHRWAGLLGARAVAAVCATVAVACLAAAARLVTHRDAEHPRLSFAPAYVFALFGLSTPVLHVSTLATYDAMALMLYAAALYLSLRGASEGARNGLLLGACCAVGAAMTRYLFFACLPVLLALVVAWAAESWRRLRRVLIGFALPTLLLAGLYQLVMGQHFRLAVAGALRKAQSCCAVAPSEVGRAIWSLLPVIGPLTALAALLAWFVYGDLRAPRVCGGRQQRIAQGALLLVLVSGTAMIPLTHLVQKNVYTAEKNLMLAALFGALLVAPVIDGAWARCPWPRWARSGGPLTVLCIAAASLWASPRWAGDQETLARLTPIVLRQWADLRPVATALRAHTHPLPGDTPLRIWVLDTLNPWELSQAVGPVLEGQNAWSGESPEQIIAHAAEQRVPLLVGHLSPGHRVGLGQVVGRYRVVEVINVPRVPNDTYYIFRFSGG